MYNAIVSRLYLAHYASVCNLQLGNWSHKKSTQAAPVIICTCLFSIRKMQN